MELKRRWSSQDIFVYLLIYVTIIYINNEYKSCEYVYITNTLWLFTLFLEYKRVFIIIHSKYSFVIYFLMHHFLGAPIIFLIIFFTLFFWSSDLSLLSRMFFAPTLSFSLSHHLLYLSPSLLLLPFAI